MPDPSYLQNRHHPVTLELWGGVVATPVDNMYLSRMFRSMVCVHFSELIPRALLLFSWF